MSRYSENRKKVLRMRETANNLAIDIKKLDAPYGDSRPTPQRVSHYLGRKKAARSLRALQEKYLIFASKLEDGTLPHILNHITTPGQLRALHFGQHVNEFPDDTQITMFSELAKLGNPHIADESVGDKITRLRLEACFLMLKDYHPTSMVWLQEMMLDLADINEGDSICEPSAGAGHLAEIIKERFPDNFLSVVETNPTLCEILTLMGLQPSRRDFTDRPYPFDVIIMHPPLSRHLDIDHVRHAYACLKDGGRLVAVMNAHALTDDTSQTAHFSKWFNRVEGVRFPLATNALKQSDVPSLAKPILVKITKKGQ